MIIRVFRAIPKPGKAGELAALVKELSIPFIDGQPGLIGRYTGTGIGATGDEIVMISVWKDLKSMMGTTGDNWKIAVIPDERLAERIQKCHVHHFETLS